MAEKEYIEREAVLRRMQKIATEAWKMRIKANVETVWNEAQDVLRFSPAADVRPVVKAKWDDKPVAFFLKCTECGCCVGHRYDVFLDRGELNFCPNCGADMRQEPT